VNWLRTLPYVRAWAAEYADAGLTVVGVHTPEFGFERDVDNVIAQTRDLGIAYPVAMDDDYAVWDAFANHYWPAAYLADAEGRIRYHHFGEGEYAMTEMAIQQLLLEAGAEGVDPDLVAVEPRGLEVAADWGTLRSSETYLGHSRSTGFASAHRARTGRPLSYAAAPELPLGYWDLAGTWTVAQHAAVLVEPGGRLAVQFHARDLNLVMGPGSGGWAGAVPRPARRRARGPRSRHRHRRRRMRDRRRRALLPAGPPARADRGPAVRDRVPRRRRRGVLRHLRLSVAPGVSR
jgi:hypothetical protein